MDCRNLRTRSFGQHAAMFIVGGTAGTLLSEVYKGGLSDIGEGFVRNKPYTNTWRFLLVTTVGAMEYYSTSSIKGGGISPYVGRPQLNKGTSIVFKNLLYSLLNIN